MQEHQLPTASEMFQHAAECVHQAYASLGDAADWLRSDWQPLGSSLTDQQGDARSAVFDRIGEAKCQLNAIVDLLDKARA